MRPSQPERRQLSVMLCDLVGWSSLAQRLDAEELAEVVQAYRQRCAGVIAKHGGTVAQYVGDGVLAYFGYPRAHEDDAERAIRAALAIAAEEPAASGSQVHIGIATGIVVVGSVLPGAAPAMPAGVDAVSAVGGAVNLAARLQALAGPGTVVVSDLTRRVSRGVFEYRDLGPHALKGFDEPVHAWQVTGESPVRSRFRALRASALTPLVDRQSELQQLRALWAATQSGHGQAVLLTGEPGAGKSRLASEVATQIVGGDGLRLSYHCSPHLQSSPLATLVHQLPVAAGLAEADDESAKLRKLARLFAPVAHDTADAVPLLAHLLGIPYESQYPALALSAQRQKQRLFEVMLRALELSAQQRPILIIVEDLHWIDPSSDELIGLVIDRLPRLPIFVILTARPEFRFERAHVEHLHLGPLDRGDSLHMIELLCGERDLPRAAVEQIADKTDGLPLFIEDLTRDALEVAARPRSDLSSERGAGLSSRLSSGSETQLAIPATLTDSLMARLDRLESAKAVAQIGAVIGREFSHELLAHVAEMPEEDLREKLYRLVESGLLVSHRAGAVLTYVFKHALVRDAAYASLLKKAQAALHARIARVLLEHFPETAEAEPAVLAYHFEAAKDIEHAVQHWVKAAKLSAKRSGFVEAIAQLQNALRLLATQLPSRARTQQELRVHLTLGGVYAEHRGFSSPECAQAYESALTLCRALSDEHGDAPEIFSVLSGVGSVEITRAKFERCRALAEECLSRAAEQSSIPPYVMGHLLLGGTLFLTAELSAARENLEKALALYEQRPAPQKKQVLYVQDQKSTGLCYLALTLTLLGETENGLSAGEQGLAYSQSLGGPHTINFSLCYLAAVCHIQRLTRPALERATDSLTYAREQGFATWVGVSQMVRGAALVRSGEFQTGLQEIEEGIHAYSAIDAIAYQPFGLSLYAEGLVANGRLDDALATVRRALAMTERTGERFYVAEIWRQQGEILAKLGDVADGESSVRKAIALAQQQGARLFELRSAVTVCRMLEGERRAAALRDVLEPVYRALEGSLGTIDLHEAKTLLY